MKLNYCNSMKHLSVNIVVCYAFVFLMIATAGAAPSAAPAGGASSAGAPVSAPAASSFALLPVGTPSSRQGSLTSTQQGQVSAAGSSQLSAPIGQAAEGTGVAPQSALQQATNQTNANQLTVQPTVSKSVSDPSAIEVAMLAAGTLRQFGYSYFRAGTDQFAAMNDIPIGPDYMLGTGDRINLTIWGSIDGTYQLELNRSGEIVIPKVGPIKVAGVTFGQLPQLLSGQLSKLYRNFQLNVTMGKLRLIKVYVVGNVTTPGDYTVTSMSTVLNALSAAGGPTRNGSLRNIAIRRDGKLVDTVDLYDFFLKGDKSRDIRLQPGDTVFVPSIGTVAGITGNVRQPAIFELKTEKTLKDLLALADGIVPTGYLQRLQISRVDAYEKKSVTDVNLDPKTTGKDLDSLSADIPIKDMDLVKIFPIDSTLRGYVRLSGYVLRPGDYAIKAGMTLRDLLPPDNLLPEYHQSVGSLIRLVAPDYHPEMVVINPANAAAGMPGFNLELHEFDTVRIYSRWEMEEMPRVRIGGEVQHPGEYRLMEGMRVRDLLYTAGNTRLTAFLKNAELVRTRLKGDSVSTSSVNINLERALENDPKHNLVLEPFDELNIRRIPQWAEEKERYVVITGEVLFPGSYQIFKGEHISDVLRRCGGYTDKAFMRGTKFTRRSVRELQQKRMDEVIVKTEKDIAQKQALLASVSSSKEELDATRTSLEALSLNVERMKSLKAEGRVVMRLSAIAKIRQSGYDLLLEGGDELYIPPNPGVVNIMGQVYNPTTFVYQEGRDVDLYLQKAGGATNEAELSEMYIVRADGSVFSRQQSSFGIQWNEEGRGWSIGSFLSATLEPGDTLVVPQKLDKISWMRELKDITQIMANIAVSAGTIFLGFR